MWLIVMFDLPTDTEEAKKAYREFRKVLLNDGFIMLQYSVYGRHSPSEENLRVHENRVKAHIPDDGQVRLISLTDKQFERMKVYYGNVRKATEKAPEQISFF